MLVLHFLPLSREDADFQNSESKPQKTITFSAIRVKRMITSPQDIVASKWMLCQKRKENQNWNPICTRERVESLENEEREKIKAMFLTMFSSLSRWLTFYVIICTISLLSFLLATTKQTTIIQLQPINNFIFWLKVSCFESNKTYCTIRRLPASLGMLA